MEMSVLFRIGVMMPELYFSEVVMNTCVPRHKLGGPFEETSKQIQNKPHFSESSLMSGMCYLVCALNSKVIKRDTLASQDIYIILL